MAAETDACSDYIRAYTFPGCVVTHWPFHAYTETRFADGTFVPAAPEDTDKYRADAVRLGYFSDTARMSFEHEWLHVFLAVKHELPHSPTLWALAHGEKADDTEHLEEEEEVLFMQACLNGKRLAATLQRSDWVEEARKYLRRG